MSWLLYYFAIELIHISLKWRLKLKLSLKKRYLLLTEFEVCTLNYRPNFFRSDIWPKRAGHKSERKNSGDRENEFSKIFILSLGLNKGGIFQYKQTFEFSGPCSEIRLAKSYIDTYLSHCILFSFSMRIKWMCLVLGPPRDFLGLLGQTHGEM